MSVGFFNIILLLGIFIIYFLSYTMMGDFIKKSVDDKSVDGRYRLTTKNVKSNIIINVIFFLLLIVTSYFFDQKIGPEAVSDNLSILALMLVFLMFVFKMFVFMAAQSKRYRGYGQEEIEGFDMAIKIILLLRLIISLIATYSISMILTPFIQSFSVT